MTDWSPTPPVSPDCMLERRVEIDQVHAFIGDVLAQDGQVIAVEESVLSGGLWHI